MTSDHDMPFRTLDKPIACAPGPRVPPPPRPASRLLGAIAALCWALAMPALAEVVVLVPGYLSDADGWRASGVGRALAEAGWRDGGDLRWGPRGPLLPHATALGPRSFYTVALPTEAPLGVQARFLTGYVDALRPRHPGEGVTLVGHSAGGVVARLYMVQNPDSGVGALVTFASPHLGTETAEIASLLGQTPLAWVAPLIGAGTLNRSQGLYRDLSRENPQGVLFWLNRQPHPPARYVSVVRADPGLLGVGDVVVPEWSQDLNNVLALRGRASRVSISAGHGLSPEDGEVLTRILAGLGSS